MARPEHGLPKGYQLRCVLESEQTWTVGEALPQQDPRMGGRPRHYPTWVYAVFLAMVTIHTSARKAATEMADNWPTIQEAGRRRYPNDPSKWARGRPMRRHHWQHLKRMIKPSGPAVADILEAFEASAAQLAPQAGVCDPRGPGSLSHPDTSRVLVGDGKVITPLYKAKKGMRRVDRKTGEILGDKKYDPDAKLHTTGGGHPAFGNKFVIFAARIDHWHSRWIVGFEPVPTVGGEAKAALACLDRAVPRVSGAQAVLYDGAMRGVHHRHALRLLGIQMISPPTAARAKTKDADREEKSTFIEATDHEAAPGGLLSIYAKGGAVGFVDYDADGEPHFTAFVRLGVKRRRNADGTWRWYCDYRLPPQLGGDRIRIRMDTTAEDDERGVNRCENARIVAPTDPDYERIYPLRSDIEACNRQLDDTLWLRRAHSVGAQAQLVDLVGYALVYNAVALALARERANGPPSEALAA